MAEIESKRNSDRAESAEPLTDDEPLAEDQQKALNNIMADIQAKRNRAAMSQPFSDEDGEAPIVTAENQEDRRGSSKSENLTLDEFDSELSNLPSANTDSDAVLPNKQTPSEARPVSNSGVTESVQENAQPQSGGQSDSDTAQAAMANEPEKPVEDDEPVVHEVTVDIQVAPTKNVLLKIRLSLNELFILSPDTTASLSQWGGDQPQGLTETEEQFDNENLHPCQKPEH